MGHHRRFPMAFLLVVAGSALCSAAEPEQIQEFGESIDVRLVNVEAVVTDGRGELVRGLAAADFRLLVDGREVPVEYFTEVAGGKAASLVDPAGPAPALPAGQAVGRSYLVYVDDSFALANVRDAMLARVERDLTLLQPEDRMAVLAFDGRRIAVLSGWTADVAALRAALERVRGSQSEGTRQLMHQRALQRDIDWAREMGLDPDELAAFVDAAGHRISPEARTQLGRTAAAAAGALRGFPTPPGRKAMLLLSAAWTMEVAPQLYGPMLEAANRLGYTVYPVDLGQSDVDDVSAFGALAAVTGGRVVVSAKLESFREVVADTGSYYWLGFTPAWKADDGRHRITVEPRRAGLKVRSRDGFSDLSPATVNALRAESVALFGAAAEDRRLVVQLGKPRRVSHGQLEIPVTLGVPVASLALTPQGTGYVAETPLAILATDEKGGRADLPPTHLKVMLRTLPKAGTFARFRTTLRVRDLGQTLVFSVLDPAKGSSIWGEASYAPAEPSSRRRARAVPAPPAPGRGPARMNSRASLLSQGEPDGRPSRSALSSFLGDSP